jgi:hypothetical protein
MNIFHGRNQTTFYNILFFLLLILMVGFAWKIHSSFLLNWDVSWCMHIAARLFQGGDYVKDFLDVNLPLALYLYLPPNFLKNLFSISIIESARIYLFMLGALSTSLCFYFLRQIFKEKDAILAYVFTLVVAFVLFILPMVHLGQREYLFLVFTLPYLFALSVEWRDHSLSTFSKFFVSVFAFIGFVIKPYFFFTFLFIELYYLVFSRNMLSWLRLEVFIIISLTIAYIAFIFIFYPSYVDTIVPFSLKYFYAKNFSVTPWSELFVNGIVIYALLAGIFSFICHKKNPYQILSHILMMGMLGAAFSFFVQRVNWTYHLLPLFGFSILLTTLTFSLLIKDLKKTAMSYIFFGMLSIYFFYYPVQVILVHHQAGLFFPKKMHTLIQYMKSHTYEKPVYFLSVTIQDALPAIDYSQAILASRFAHLPWLPGILAEDANRPNHFLVNIIANDLNNQKPEYVFVDSRKYKDYRSQDFDYIQYFSHSPEFKTAFQSYHYIETIEQSPNVDKNIHILFYSFPTLTKTQIEMQKALPDKFNKIFLVGKGDTRVAYTYKNDESTLRSVNIKLTSSEQAFLDANQSGLIAYHENNLIRETLIQKIVSATYPYYKLDVYQRD